jgi:hypothetical protein
MPRYRFPSQPSKYEGVSKSFQTGRLERELQIIKLSATRCSCIAILWVSLVSFAVITLRVVSQRVFIVVSIYFVIDAVRKLLDTPSYLPHRNLLHMNNLNVSWMIYEVPRYEVPSIPSLHYFVPNKDRKVYSKSTNTLKTRSLWVCIRHWPWYSCTADTNSLLRA